MWRSRTATSFVGYRAPGSTDRLLGYGRTRRPRAVERNGSLAVGRRSSWTCMRRLRSRRAVRRIQRRACVEGGAGARAVRRGLVAVRIEHPAVEQLRADRRGADRAKDARRRARGTRRPLGDERQDAMYPPALKSPYAERRSAFGREHYSALGDCARGQGSAPARGHGATGSVSARQPPCSAASTATWGGPNGPTSACICRPSCCCSAPKGCQLHTDGVVAGSETVAKFLSPPDGLILFCGMSIGYEDPTVSYVRRPRPARRDGHASSAVSHNPLIDHCPVSYDSSLHLLTTASGPSRHFAAMLSERNAHSRAALAEPIYEYAAC